MSMDPCYHAFINFLPELFSQVVDGVPEKRYDTKPHIGHFTVKLLKSTPATFEPTIFSCGSLNLSYIADYARKFFTNVPLGDFYGVSTELERDALKAVFKQILMGVAKQEHDLKGFVKVVVSLDALYLSYFVNVKTEKELDGDEVVHREGLEKLLSDYLQTPNLFDYFGHSSK